MLRPIALMIQAILSISHDNENIEDEYKNDIDATTLTTEEKRAIFESLQDPDFWIFLNPFRVTNVAVAYVPLGAMVSVSCEYTLPPPVDMDHIAERTNRTVRFLEEVINTWDERLEEDGKMLTETLSITGIATWRVDLPTITPAPDTETPPTHTGGGRKKYAKKSGMKKRITRKKSARRV
jgi:hypothetical protein